MCARADHLPIGEPLNKRCEKDRGLDASQRCADAMHELRVQNARLPLSRLQQWSKTFRDERICLRISVCRIKHYV